MGEPCLKCQHCKNVDGEINWKRKLTIDSIGVFYLCIECFNLTRDLDEALTLELD